MKAYIIQSGHFSQAGNFMGFSAKGEKIHIYKKDIVGLFPNSQVRFPFYCLADEKIFDDNHGTKFSRLTGISVSCNKYTIKECAVNYDANQTAILEMELESSSELVKDFIKANDKLLEKIKKMEWDLNKAKSQNYADDNAELEEDNKRLREDIKYMTWDLENSESERERLEKLCKEHEETIKNYQHVVTKIKELTSHDLDNLIALA